MHVTRTSTQCMHAQLLVLYLEKRMLTESLRVRSLYSSKQLGGSRGKNIPRLALIKQATRLSEPHRLEFLCHILEG